MDAETNLDESTDVCAFSTDTRSLSASETARRIRAVASRASALSHPPEIVFKKIDSLLRGNPGFEIMTTLQAFDCEIAIVTPAFPEMGRRVRQGYLRVDEDADWNAIYVPAMLQSRGVEGCTHAHCGGLRDAIASGSSVISLDAVSNEDLIQIVNTAFECGRRVLWAGSGGLAAALANVLYPSPVAPQTRVDVGGPVLFCIGSDHPVTAAQVAFLQAQGESPILRVFRNDASVGALRKLFESYHGLGAILISGGDTATFVCRAIECSTIQLEGEIVTGLPWGRFVGGLFDGFAVATKSGAFGKPDALIRVADFFACRKQ